jgi:hypothetical protein
VSTDDVLLQLALDKESLLDSKFMRRIIEERHEDKIYKASYRYPSKVSQLKNPNPLNFYINFFRSLIERKSVAAKEWEPALIGNSLFIGQVKGVSKIGNKRDIKVGKETRPIERELLISGLVILCISIGALIMAIIYSNIYSISDVNPALFNFLAYQDMGSLFYWMSIPLLLGSLYILGYRYFWYRNRFFYKKVGTEKLAISVIIIMIISITFGVLTLLIEFISGIGIRWLVSIIYLTFIIGVGLFSLLTYYLLKTYFKKDPELTGRYLSTVWIRYQALVTFDDLTSEDFEKLDIEELVQKHPSKLAIQVLVAWDFKTISQAFADIEGAKTELARLINEIGMVFGGSISVG